MPTPTIIGNATLYCGDSSHNGEQIKCGKGIVRTTEQRIYCRFGGNSSYSGNPPDS